jgi:hypothetical protein
MSPAGSAFSANAHHHGVGAHRQGRRDLSAAADATADDQRNGLQAFDSECAVHEGREAGRAGISGALAS